MSAAKENTKISVIVKSLTGEQFEVKVGHDAGADAVKQYLYTQYPNSFSPSDAFDMQLKNNEGNEPGMIQDGAMYSVIMVPKRLVKLVSCTPLNEEKKQEGVIYTFEIDRKDGLTILDMTHRQDRNARTPSGRRIPSKRYTRDEIEEYYNDDTKPNFILRVVYEPSVSHYYQVMGEWNQRPLGDGRIKNDLSDDLVYFEKTRFFSIYPPDDVQRDINQITFQLKPDTARELVGWLRFYQHTCTSTNLQSAKGGKRSKYNSKRHSKRHSKRRSKRRSKRTRKHRISK